MASVADIERGNESQPQRMLRWLRSPRHSSNILRRLMRLLRGSARVTVEPLIQADSRKAGNAAGLVTERLTVAMVAHLVYCDVAYLESLNLRMSPCDDGTAAAVESSKDNVSKLISHYGHKVVNARCSENMSLLQESIICNALECAKQLFTHAAEHGISVVLQWGEEDILGLALKNEQKTTAAFVLERIVEKCSTPSESVSVIREHLDAFVKSIPRTMQKLLETDSFCFEYGRFQVPAEIFCRECWSEHLQATGQ